MWEQLLTPDFGRMSVLEMGMLLCFGASWPAAILKTIAAKNPVGKSMLFLALVIIGYICGALHKIFYQPDFVFWLYILNLLMVCTDYVLVIHYKRQRRKEAVLIQAQAQE